MIFHDPHTTRTRNFQRFRGKARVFCDLQADSGEVGGDNSGETKRIHALPETIPSMPRMPVTNEGLVRNSLLKMVHNAGGDDCILVENVETVRCAFPQFTLISISEFQNSNWMGHHWIKPTNLQKSSNQLPTNFDGPILPGSPQPSY